MHSRWMCIQDIQIQDGSIEDGHILDGCIKNWCIQKCMHLRWKRSKWKHEKCENSQWEQILREKKKDAHCALWRMHIEIETNWEIEKSQWGRNKEDAPNNSHTVYCSCFVLPHLRRMAVSWVQEYLPSFSSPDPLLL